MNDHDTLRHDIAWQTGVSGVQRLLRVLQLSGGLKALRVKSCAMDLMNLQIKIFIESFSSAPEGISIVAVVGIPAIGFLLRDSLFPNHGTMTGGVKKLCAASLTPSSFLAFSGSGGSGCGSPVNPFPSQAWQVTRFSP